MNPVHAARKRTPESDATQHPLDFIKSARRHVAALTDVLAVAIEHEAHEVGSLTADSVLGVLHVMGVFLGEIATAVAELDDDYDVRRVDQ